MADVAKDKAGPKPATAVSSANPLTWYKATYDEEKTARYCGGKLKLWEFILLHVLVLVNLFVLVLLPTIYFVLLPNYLQLRVENFGKTAGDPPIIRNIGVGTLQKDGIPLAVDVTLGPLAPYPILLGFEPMTATVHDELDKRLISVELPRYDTWTNKPTDIKFSTVLRVNDEAQENLQAFVSRVSSDEGIKNLKVTLRFIVPLRIGGYQLYSGMRLFREIEIGALRADLGALFSPTTNALSRAGNTPNSKLRAKFDAKDIFEVTKDFGVVLRDLAINMKDEGVGIAIEAAFENPTPVTINLIESIDFYLALEKTNAVHIGIRKLALDAELMESFKLAIDIDFAYQGIDPAKVRDAITAASRNFASKGDFSVALAGPLKLTGADFLTKATAPLALKLPLGSILAGLLGRTPNATVAATTRAPGDNSTVAPAPGLLDLILAKSSISVDVLSDKVQVPLGIVLPVIFPLPPSVAFPYGTTISIYGGQQKTIQADVAPITIIRNDQGIFINTTLTVTPTNTDAAATALANAVNPILAADARSTEIGIRDLAFFPVNAGVRGANFKWCNDIFAVVVVPFALPPLPVASLISGLASRPAAPASATPAPSLVSIRTLQLAQLTAAPGFGVKGTIDVSYPAGLPKIMVNIGYFGLKVNVEEADFASLVLPTGLQFFPQVQGTNIDAALTFSNDPRLPAKLQVLVDAVLKGTPLPSYIGVSGITFGLSATTNIITFSKISVQVGTAAITGLLSGGGSSSDAPSSGGLLPPNFLTLTGVDAGLVSSQALAVAVQSTIINPLPLSISIGTISANVILDDDVLVGLTLAPINVALGTGPLAIGLDARISTGANGLQGKVARLAGAVLSGNFTGVSTLIGATGIKISPVGQTTGPGVIDLIQNVKIQLPVSSLLAPAPAAATPAPASTTPGPINLSAILPAAVLANPLGAFALVPRYIEALGRSQATLRLGGDVGYTNPLPVSARIPYVGVSAALGGEVLVDVELVGLQLNRTSGIIQPRVALFMKNGGNGADNVNSILLNFLEGKINPAVNVRGLYFGTSATDRNDLAAGVDVNLTPLLSGIAATSGPALKETINNLVKGLIGGGAAAPAPAALPAPAPAAAAAAPSGALLSLNLLGIGIDVNGADIAIQSGSVINATAKGVVRSPIALNIDLPYVGLAADVNQANIVDVAVSLSAQGVNAVPLSVTVLAKLSEDEAVQVSVATIADAVQRSQLDLIDKYVVSAGRLRLGASPSDYIDSFSKIGGGLPLAPLLKGLLGIGAPATVPAPGAAAPSGPGLLEIIALKLGAIGIDAQPQRTLAASVGATLTNPFPITLSGIGYVSAVAGIDGETVVVATVPRLGLGRGVNNLTLAANLQFPSSEKTQDKVLSLFQGIYSGKAGKTPEIFTIARLGLGVSSTDYIKLLSKVVIYLPSSSILTPELLGGLGLGGGAATGAPAAGGLNLAQLFSLQSVDVLINSVPKIDALIKAGVMLPINIAANVPFVGLGTKIDDVSAIGVVVKGLATRGLGPNNVTLDASLLINDTKPLEDKIGGITLAIAKNETVPGTIFAGAPRLGVSAEDSIDTFVKVGLPFAVSDVIGLVSGLLSAPASNTTAPAGPSILQIINPQLGAAGVVAKTGRVLEAGATIAATNPFPVSVKGLGFLTATAGLDGIPVVVANVKGFDVAGSSRNSISTLAGFFFPSSPVIQDKVRDFTNVILKDGLGKNTEKITARGIQFGTSPETAYKFLRSAILGLPSTTIFNDQLLGGLLGGGGAGGGLDLGKLVSLQGVDVLLNPFTRIDAGVRAALNLALPVSVSVPFVGASTAIDSVPAFGLGVKGLGVKAGGANNLTLDASVSFRDTDELADKIGMISNAIFLGAEPTGTIAIGAPVLGVDSDPANVIDTFSKIFLPLPVKTVLGAVLGAPSNATAAPAGPSILDALAPQIRSLAVAAKVGRVLEIGVGLGVNNVFPVTVTGLGYLAAATELDDTTLFTVAAGGLNIAKGANNLPVVADLFFPSSDAIKQKVGQLVKQILLKDFANIKQKAEILEPLFGTSQATAYKFLRKVVIALPVSSFVNANTIGGLLGGGAAPAGNATASGLNLAQLFSLQGVDVQINPAPRIDAAVKAGVMLPLPVTIDLPFVKIGAKVDDVDAFALAVQTRLVGARGPNNATIGANLFVSDTDALADKVATIVGGLLKGTPVTNTIFAGAPVLGATNKPEDVIDTFSLIGLPFSVTDIAGLVGGAAGGNSSILSVIAPKLAGAAVAAKAGRSLEAKINLDATNPFPVSVKGLNHIGAFAGLDDVIPVFVLGVSGVELVGAARNNLAINANLQFPPSEKAQAKVTTFVNTILKNGLGTTSELITATGITFGANRETALKFLSKAVVGLPSSLVFNNNLLALIAPPAAPAGNTTVPAPAAGLGDLVGLEKADITLRENAVISAAVAATLKLKLPVSLDIPFVGLGAQIDDVRAFGVGVQGVTTSAGVENKLTLGAAVQINDVPELEAKIGAITRAIAFKQEVKSVVYAGAPRLGVSAEDNIDTFAKIVLPFAVTDLIAMLSGPAPAGNATAPAGPSILQIIKPQFGLEALNTKQARSLEVGLVAAATNPFPVSVKGLGFVRGGLGLDDVIPIIGFGMRGFEVQAAARNNIATIATLQFPSSDAIKAKVAAFTNVILQQGLGKNTEKISASGIQFGPTPETAYKFLRSAVLGLPASDILNDQVVGALLGGGAGLPSISSLLSLVEVRDLDINGATAGVLNVAASVAIKNVTLATKVDVGFAGFNAFVASAPLAKVGIDSGIKVVSSAEKKELVLSLKTGIVLAEGEDIKQTIARLFMLLDAPANATTGLSLPVGAAGIVFGANSLDNIDSFVGVQVGFDAAPFLPKIKEIINGVTSSAGGIGFAVTDATLDVVSETALSLDAEVALSGLPAGLKVNLPWIQAGVKLDNNDFLGAAISGTTVAGNSLKTKVVLDFAANPALAGAVLKITSDVIFHRNVSYVNTIASVAGVAFGASDKNTFKTLQYAKLNLPIRNTVIGLRNYVDAARPIKLLDVTSKIVDSGITGSFQATAIPAKVTFKAPRIDAKIKYVVPGATPGLFNVADVAFTELVNTPGQNIASKLDVAIDVSSVETGVFKALADDLQYLLTWSDFAQNALLGYIKLTGSNGAVFKTFEQAAFKAPDLYLWRPIRLGFVGGNPLAEGVVLPISVRVSFANGGPLQLDVGEVLAALTTADGKPLLEVTNFESLLIKNSNNGGNTENGSNPENNIFSIRLPLADFNPLEIPGLIASLFTGAIQTKISLLRDDKEIAWVSKVTAFLAQAKAFDNIPKLLGSLLANIKLDTLPITVGALPGQQEIAVASDSFLKSIPQGALIIDAI
ncbi:hypothetical protein BC831DRAFT_548409 [Entophlyctis helioformis]|nr:hypothetical protein BC831DRAFT_548409 [Entophlyctis helioformis]